METLSQAEVGSALQIYFNLNELPKVKLGICSTNNPARHQSLPSSWPPLTPISDML